MGRPRRLPGHIGEVMIAFKLYQHPEPDLIHRFSILEPQVSKFSVSTCTEEREARRSLAPARAAEHKDGRAEAAARVLGARVPQDGRGGGKGGVVQWKQRR